MVGVPGAGYTLTSAVKPGKECACCARGLRRFSEIIVTLCPQERRERMYIHYIGKGAFEPCTDQQSPTNAQ